MYVTRSSDLPEQAGQPNNLRAPVMGRSMSLSRIRWVHPAKLPKHTHDVGQATVMVQGDSRPYRLASGDVTVIPPGVPHSGRSLAGEAVFLEVFAPRRPELLPGALGYDIFPRTPGE